MAIWTFFDYVSPVGNNLILKWMQKLTVQERSDLDTLLDILSNQKRWQKPEFRWLSGKQQGLGEIRFKSAQKTPLRLIGTKGREPNQFIFLIGCSHKDNYDPPNALDTAVKNNKKLANDASICEHGEKGHGEEN